MLSPVVYYEVKRGLKDKKAEKQLKYFDEIADSMVWIDYQKEDWDYAIDLYLKLKAKGFSPHHQDADILIAAQACRTGAFVITNNLKDFERLEVECYSWV
jgi:predicted nucleic acid-binding protein